MALLMLFDANGSFGSGAKARPDLETPADLLAHMDRLGIARALVWHVAARDLNPTWGNRRLGQAIQATDGAEERLTPTYTIAPTMLYEPGAMEDLVGAMSSGQVRALWVFPGALRHNLDQVEPVIREVVQFRPVLFVEGRDSPDAHEFLALAERFRDVPMVYMQGMWGQLVTILDLMRRRENILTDTSWLHTPETIELIVKEFGAERALFSTGPKAHNGASIAALAYAEIGETERQLIAHGNLERLLGLGATEPDMVRRMKDAGSPGDSWMKFLAGEPVDADIIDAHAHLGPSGIAVVRRREMDEHIAYALQRMDRLNIRMTIASGMRALFSDPVEGNKELEASVRPYVDRFRGYLAFNPFYDRAMVPRFDEFFSGEFFVGFKVLCDYWRVPLTDPRFEPVWEYANLHRLPILLHTWEGAYNSPALLKEIVKDYPRAMFLLGHSGGGNAGRREAEELALSNDNVYLEFCGSFTSDIPWEETIARVGSTRVLFGTDETFHDPAWELGRLLSLGVPWETLLPILGRNTRRILAART